MAIFLLMAGAVAGGVAGLAVRAVIARFSLQRRSAKIVRSLGENRYRAVDVLANGKVVVVEGKAVSTGTANRVVAMSVRDGSMVRSSNVSELRIVVDDAQLPVEGGLQVVLGSEGSTRAIDVSRHGDTLARARQWSGQHPMQLLREGDAVVARGVLRDEAAGGARQADVVRTLCPPVGEVSVRVAFLGAPRDVGPSRGAFVSAGLGALLALGSGAYTERLSPPAEYSNVDSVREARAHWELAEFDKASVAFGRAVKEGPLPEPSVTEIAAHLFANRNRESAAAARRLAAKKPQAATPLICFADAVEVRAGDRARLRDLDVAAATDPRCALLGADLLSGGERREFIARHWHPAWAYEWEGDHDPWIRDDAALDSYVFYLLRREVEPWRFVRAPSWYRPEAFWPGRHVLRLPVALMARVRETLSETKEVDARVDYDIHSAVFLSYVGEHPRARNEIDKALGRRGALACADHPDARCATGDRDVLSVGAALAMRAGEYPRARSLLHHAAVASESHGYAVLSPYIDLMETGDSQAFALIAAGHPGDPDWQLASTSGHDGAALAAALADAHRDGRTVLPFIGKYIQSNNEALSRFVETSYPPPCWECGPHALLDHVAARREAAQALGMRVFDARLGIVMERLLAVFSRRDLAVPIHVLARISGP